MQLADLSTLSLTYAPVGLTRHGPPPDGFAHLGVTRRLGSGDAAYRAAAEAVMTFGAQRGTGLRPQATAPRAAEGVDLVSHLGPCRHPLPRRVGRRGAGPHGLRLRHARRTPGGRRGGRSSSSAAGTTWSGSSAPTRDPPPAGPAGWSPHRCPAAADGAGLPGRPPARDPPSHRLTAPTQPHNTAVAWQDGRHSSRFATQRPCCGVVRVSRRRSCAVRAAPRGARRASGPPGPAPWPRARARPRPARQGSSGGRRGGSPAR